jgi:hypothetical protein
MAEQPKMNLTQKLAKIRAMSDVVSKEKRGYNYSYADITTISCEHHKRHEEVWGFSYPINRPGDGKCGAERRRQH